MCEIMVGLLREEKSSISHFVVNFVPPGLAKACFLSFFLLGYMEASQETKNTTIILG